MATLPQLIEEDIQQIGIVLTDFLTQTSSTAALVIDKGGFLITQAGEAGDLDFTTIAALASGAFMASQTIAGLVNETNFKSTYQQGEKFSLFILEIDDQCLLTIIFASKGGLGVVKYYSTSTATCIAQQLKVAQERNPDGGFDLSVMNIADPQELFRKKST